MSEVEARPHAIVLAPTSEARLAAAHAWLESFSAPEILILGATRRAADDFARASAALRPGVTGLHRSTLRALAADLATRTLATEGRAIVTRLGAEALVARAIDAALTAEPLEYFQPVAHMPGFARALAGTLSELGVEAVSLEALATLGARGRDLLRLERAYSTELERRKLADPRRVLELAMAEARSGTHRLLDRPTLLLDAPPRNALEVELVSRVRARSGRVFATVSSYDTEGLEALTKALGVEPEIRTPRASSRALHRAQTRLFARADAEAEVDGTPTQDSPSPDPTDTGLARTWPDGLELFSAPGEGRECIEIARRVLVAAEAGCPFDRMAVLLRSPEAYQPLVEDALARAGVPAFFTRGTKRPDPAGRALLLLLACRLEGLSAVRFAEYLSLGQAASVDDEGAPRTRQVPWVAPKDETQLVFASLEIEPKPDTELEPAPSADAPVVHGTLNAPIGWEALLVEASVVGGDPERWRRRLRGLRQTLELKRRAVADSDETRRIHIDREIERLSDLERFALPIVTHLARMPKALRWGEWLAELRMLAGLALRRIEGVAEVLAELEPMQDVGPVSLEEVVSVLSERLTLLRSEPADRRFGRVFVGTIEEAAGRSFEVVFLPGLAEGIFPRKAFEDPLLLDEHRHAVSEDLRTREGRSHDERLLFALSIGAARSVLCASYPRMEAAEGKPRVPSFYALDLLRAAEGALPDARALEARAARSASARLGWPAPTNVDDAIDDAEYDLAVLEPLVRSGSIQANVGRARYLLRVNPHLERALRFRAQRSRQSWSTGDGLVKRDPRTRARLEAFALTKRAYSATDLERFAVCPYQFYLRSIQRLREREAPVRIEELDPATRGSLFHEVLFHAFETLTKAGLWPMRAEAFQTTAEAMDRVLDRVAAEYAERLVPAIPRVFEREVEEIRKDLYGFIHAVTTRDHEWAPAHAELGFGDAKDNAQDGRDAASLDAPVRILDSYDIRGRIDLVERHRALERLRVTDYKTGRVPSPAPRYVGGGMHLQPMIYALVVEKMLGGSVAKGSLFYCTTNADFTRVEIDVTKEARSAVEEALGIVARAVSDAFLPAAPKKDACALCDYRAACGDDVEERVVRKDASALVSIDALRRIP